MKIFSIVFAAIVLSSGAAIADSSMARFNCTAVPGGYAGIPDDIGIFILDGERDAAYLLGLQFLNLRNETGRVRSYGNGLGFVVRFPVKMFNGSSGKIVVSRYDGGVREDEGDTDSEKAGEKEFQCEIFH